MKRCGPLRASYFNCYARRHQYVYKRLRIGPPHRGVDANGHPGSDSLQGDSYVMTGHKRNLWKGNVPSVSRPTKRGAPRKAENDMSLIDSIPGNPTLQMQVPAQEGGRHVGKGVGGLAQAVSEYEPADERVDSQIHQEANALLQQVPGEKKRLVCRFGLPSGLSRIRDAPMRGYRGCWPRRTHCAGHLITHGDHEIHHRRPLRVNSSQPLLRRSSVGSRPHGGLPVFGDK